MDRIKGELAARNWSQAELSRRMEQSVLSDKSKGWAGGSVINQGVLSKLLRPEEARRKADGQRHISIDQLITLAAVFEVPLAELLVPPSTLTLMRGWRYFDEAAEIENERRGLNTKRMERLADLRSMVEESPELRDDLLDEARTLYRRRRAELMDGIRADALHREPLPDDFWDEELRGYGLHRIPVITVATELFDPVAASRGDVALYEAAKRLFHDEGDMP